MTRATQNRAKRPPTTEDTTLARMRNLCSLPNRLDHGNEPLPSEELQLRNHHSILYHRTTHLSLQHLQEQHLEREGMHCGYLSLRRNWNTISL